MSTSEQFAQLCVENDVLERQQKKVSELKDSLVESLRQRALRIADAGSETVEVFGFGCFAEEARAVGEYWYDEEERCRRWVVTAHGDRVYSATSGEIGYRQYVCSRISELSQCPPEYLREHFKTLFDE